MTLTDRDIAGMLGDYPHPSREVTLAGIAVAAGVAPTARARDTGLWQALARRFAPQTRLILAIGDRETWAGTVYALRRFTRPADREAVIIRDMVNVYAPRHLAAPNAPMSSIYVNVSKRGPAPGPNAVNLADIAPDIWKIREQVARATSVPTYAVTRMVLEMSESYPRGLVWCHTDRGDCVPFDPQVLAGVTHPTRDETLRIAGPTLPATVANGSEVVGVVMPIRHPASSWVD